MNEKKLVLSIVIPTYNGATTISETLDSIIPQVEKGVEIVVSDNASTDNTPGIVEQYQAKCHNIRYYRNSKNMGVDRNCDLGVQRSSGDYIWFLGDDDKILYGGIRKVLDVISSHQDLALMFVNCSMWNRNFTECYKERFLSLDNDVIYNNADDYFQLIGTSAALTPTTIVNRKLWIETNTTPFDGTGWNVLCKLFYMLPGRSAYIISTPYSLFRDGSIRCHIDGGFYKMVIPLACLINNLPSKGYNITTYRKLISPLLRKLPHTIAVEKIYGLKLTKRLINDSITIFGKYNSFWLVSFPMLFIPKSVYRLILRIYKRNSPLLRL
jgi:glycosyltransferase involved in cell wall biosynthesis